MLKVFPITSVQELLLRACVKGDLAEVRRVLEQRGAAVNKPTGGQSPLVVAVVNGHLSLVQLLVEQQGADIHQAVDDRGRMAPLCAALTAEQWHVASYLITKGARVDQMDCKGTTHLISAAYNGRMAAVKYLVIHGADKQHHNVYGVTPLEAATSQGHTAVAAFLRAAGCRLH